MLPKNVIRLFPVLILLCGCASSAPATATPGALGSPLRPTVQPVQDDLVIFYERSGGIAGRLGQWTIYPDGRGATWRRLIQAIVDGAGATKKADPGKLATLLAIARDPKTLGLTSPAGRQCPDCYAYTVRITTAGKTTTLATYDAVVNPPELDALLAALADVTR